MIGLGTTAANEANAALVGGKIYTWYHVGTLVLAAVAVWFGPQTWDFTVISPNLVLIVLAFAEAILLAATSFHIHLLHLQRIVTMTEPTTPANPNDAASSRHPRPFREEQAWKEIGETTFAPGTRNALFIGFIIFFGDAADPTADAAQYLCCLGGAT